MDKQNLNQVSRALLAAWDKSVERALDDAARTEALTEPQLNNVAGMRVESGLRGGGLWGSSEHDTCTCGFSCVYC